MLHDKQAACEILGISMRSLQRLMQERRISFYKDGGYIRFSDKDIEAYLDRCRVEARSPVSMTEKSRGKATAKDMSRTLSGHCEYYPGMKVV